MKQRGKMPQNQCCMQAAISFGLEQARLRNKRHMVLNTAAMLCVCVCVCVCLTSTSAKSVLMTLYEYVCVCVCVCVCVYVCVPHTSTSAKSILMSVFFSPWGFSSKYVML